MKHQVFLKLNKIIFTIILLAPLARYLVQIFSTDLYFKEFLGVFIVFILIAGLYLHTVFVAWQYLSKYYPKGFFLFNISLLLLILCFALYQFDLLLRIYHLSFWESFEAMLLVIFSLACIPASLVPVLSYSKSHKNQYNFIKSLQFAAIWAVLVLLSMVSIVILGEEILKFNFRYFQPLVIVCYISPIFVFGFSIISLLITRYRNGKVRAVTVNKRSGRLAKYYNRNEKKLLWIFGILSVLCLAALVTFFITTRSPNRFSFEDYEECDEITNVYSCKQRYFGAGYKMEDNEVCFVSGITMCIDGGPGCGGCHQYQWLVEGVDAETFTIVYEHEDSANPFGVGGESLYLAKDKDNLYYQGSQVINVDVGSFEVLYPSDWQTDSEAKPFPIYFRDKDNIYCGFDIQENKAIIVEKVESESFEVLTYQDRVNAKDKNHYYEKCEITEMSPGARPYEEFSYYYLDDERVYFQQYMGQDKYNPETHEVYDSTDTELVVLENSDPGTFELIRNIKGYAKDKNNVYFNEMIVEGADPETITAIKEPGKLKSYFWYMVKDKNAAYYWGYKVPESDGQTFEPVVMMRRGYKISGDHFVDKNNVYFHDQIIPEADPESFHHLSNTSYFADDRYLFYQNKVLPESDSSEIHFTTGPFIKDADDVYYRSILIEEADHGSFNSMDFENQYLNYTMPFAADNNGAYFKHLFLDGITEENMNIESFSGSINFVHRRQDFYITGGGLVYFVRYDLDDVEDKVSELDVYDYDSFEVLDDEDLLYVIDPQTEEAESQYCTAIDKKYCYYYEERMGVLTERPKPKTYKMIPL